MLNFTFDDSDSEYYHHKVQLMDVHTGKIFYDKLTFVYLEMPKFMKSENELETMFDKWLFVLRNLSRLMQRPAALQERVFVKLFETAEIAKFTKEQYEEYEESLKVYRDWKNTIDTAVNKAENKGRAEGRAEGEKQKQIEIAFNMKNRGMGIDVISEVTGLSEYELKKLGFDS